MARPDLRSLFSGLQSELKAKLGTSRLHDHPVAKGEGSELNWAGLLTDHLPTRYQVTAPGFVIDADGNMSDQIDLVIHDRQYSTMLLNSGGVYYVPAESVYAVFEVKQDLSKYHLLYAGKKAASVRRLRRTSAPIPHAGGEFAPRPLYRILAGILAFESSWDPPFGDPFRTTLADVPSEETLDLGCALAHGAFLAGRSESGPVKVVVGSQESALVFFYLSLLDRLQGLGTAPAIDFDAYRSRLER